MADDKNIARVDQEHATIPEDPVIEAYKSGIDLSLINYNLSLSVDERFEQLMSLQRLADELRAAGERASKND